LDHRTFLQWSPGGAARSMSQGLRVLVLASISANFTVLYEYAAVYVDKFLKGANPASLPVE
jgi:hypothetical protein